MKNINRNGLLWRRKKKIAFVGENDTGRVGIFIFIFEVRFLGFFELNSFYLFLFILFREGT